MSVSLSACLSVTIVSPTYTAEPIEMPFAMWTSVGTRKNVGLCRWGGRQRHLANTTEPPVCGGDAAFFSNYFDCSCCYSDGVGPYMLYAVAGETTAGRDAVGRWARGHEVGWYWRQRDSRHAGVRQTAEADELRTDAGRPRRRRVPATNGHQLLRHRVAKNRHRGV